MRLHRDLDFERLQRRGKRLTLRHIRVRWLENDLGYARIGVRSPRRFGSAPQRNRFRRLVREVFRQCRHELPGVDLLVYPDFAHPPASIHDLQDDFRRVAQALRQRCA